MKLFSPILLLILLFLVGISNSQSQHTNILVSDTYSPNEPTIAMDPKNTDFLVAASNLNRYYVSSDGGQTWSGYTANSTYGVWGDPVVIVDTAGFFYYFHLSNPDVGSWIDRIVCQKSTDNGKTWNNGTYTGWNGVKAQDKEWAVVNRKNNHIYVTWTQFDEYGSQNPLDSTVILFSKSEDDGQNWSDPIRLNKVAGDCLDDDNTVEGAVPAVGPEGEIYVSWSGPEGLVFDLSEDGGETWLEEDIFVSDIPGGWNYTIPDIMRSNGLPVTVCDTSQGPYRGTVYINWTDQRNGTNDTDVWLVKSTDNGDTWSDPIRINDDPAGKHQFFTWMTIDQTNGFLYFVFYDRRNYDESKTDVYMAISKDGGETFINFRVSDSPFSPRPDIFFGDYTNITAYNDMVRPIWTRLENSQLSLWTALIDLNSIAGIEETSGNDFLQFTLDQNFPNPFDAVTYISFKIHKPSLISLKIYDLTGQEAVTLIDNQMYDYGEYIESFDPHKSGFASGTYYYVLKADGNVLKKKMIYIEQ